MQTLRINLFGLPSNTIIELERSLDCSIQLASRHSTVTVPDENISALLMWINAVRSKIARNTQ